MGARQPPILFRKEQPNFYMSTMPACVVDDEPENRQLLIALDDSLRFMGDRRGLRHRGASTPADSRRHGARLDAAHIVPDSEERGPPRTSNGLALCKIHHAAYDQNMLGLSQDYRVAINREVLAEIDGPMLRHGIQEMHGREIVLPRRRGDRPDREPLAWPWERLLRTRVPTDQFNGAT